MFNFYFPFALVVSGGVIYHLSQKSIPQGMNPFFATIIAYLIGIVLCAIAAVFYPGSKSFVATAKESNWAVLTLGFAVAAIELGFLLSYRVGWKIGLAAVATNVAITVLLIPVGLLVFKDHLSLRNLVGVAFCIFGLVLVVRD